MFFYELIWFKKNFIEDTINFLRNKEQHENKWRLRF
jgi:hypothetical protein